MDENCHRDGRLLLSKLRQEDVMGYLEDCPAGRSEVGGRSILGTVRARLHLATHLMSRQWGAPARVLSGDLGCKRVLLSCWQAQELTCLGGRQAPRVQVCLDSWGEVGQPHPPADGGLAAPHKRCQALLPELRQRGPRFDARQYFLLAKYGRDSHETSTEASRVHISE